MIEDIFDRFKWNLTGEEDLSLWNDQTFTWYRTERGLFLASPITIQDKYCSVCISPANAANPYWIEWDGVLPHDTIYPVSINMTGEFDLDDIELAEIFMEELK